jgi:peptidyl-prolyl cis-trans isomerase A (cyclophilin A)/peptidyl-prolyl cis-trans isomerase B (cyclophilin B)
MPSFFFATTPEKLQFVSMKKIKTVISFLTVLSLSFLSIVEASPLVQFKTNYGVITVELYQQKSPVTTANFLKYMTSGRYNGTLFHRVEKDFVIQGGGYTKTWQPVETYEPIKNEAANGLKNLKGTLAMARFTDKDSADSQFFFNLTDNPHLDHRNDTNLGYGYAVFGKVIEGMEVLDEIASLPVGERGDIGEYVPAYPVILQSVTLLAD